MTDDEILSGFTSLQEVMLAGFARMQAQIEAQTAELYSAIAASEQRMLRRFDILEQRFDGLEQRLDGLGHRSTCSSTDSMWLGDVERQLERLIEPRL